MERRAAFGGFRWRVRVAACAVALAVVSLGGGAAVGQTAVGKGEGAGAGAGAGSVGGAGAKTGGGGGELSPAEQALRKLFDDTMREVDPMTPDMHREAIRRSEETAKARTRAPKFETVMRDVPLDPTSAIPTVEFDLNLPAAISFIDMSGERWPILQNGCVWSTGFTGDPPAAGSHVLVLRAETLSDNGALVCQLEKLGTPVRLRLSAGNHRHHLGFDARVPRMGPNARVPPYDLGGGQLLAGDDVLSGFLYGIVPQSAEALDVVGGGAMTKAWRLGNDLYLRTPMVLMSQASAEASREGVHVYRLKPTAILVLDDGGRDVEIRVAGSRVVRPTVPAAFQGDGMVGRAPPEMAVKSKGGRG